MKTLGKPGGQKNRSRPCCWSKAKPFGSAIPASSGRNSPRSNRPLPSPHAVIISGLRRVGKSTLLAQLAHRLGQDRFYYINFEDDRFMGFGAEDANDLYQSLAEVFGERKVWIVDEIQNVPGWEHFVRRFMDMGFKFYITGSNASLLSRELGSRLTGRYVPVELFPFSFTEFLRFRQLVAPDLARLTTLDLGPLAAVSRRVPASGRTARAAQIS